MTRKLREMLSKSKEKNILDRKRGSLKRLKASNKASIKPRDKKTASDSRF